jgi:hypothetical protein
MGIVAGWWMGVGITVEYKWEREWEWEWTNKNGRELELKINSRSSLVATGEVSIRAKSTVVGLTTDSEMHYVTDTYASYYARLSTRALLGNYIQIYRLNL